MADKQEIPNITIEDARILFRNFAGKEKTYNAAGSRNFVVLLEDPAMVEAMERDGWNVKYLRPREEDPDAQLQPYIQVVVGYKGRPPRIAMITSRGRTLLGEEEVSVLDFAEIEHVDLIIRPYQWAVNGKSGIKAYLKTLYVTIREDELELKYSNVPDTNQTPGYEE